MEDELKNKMEESMTEILSESKIEIEEARSSNR